MWENFSVLSTKNFTYNSISFSDGSLRKVHAMNLQAGGNVGSNHWTVIRFSLKVSFDNVLSVFTRNSKGRFIRSTFLLIKLTNWKRLYLAELINLEIARLTKSWSNKPSGFTSLITVGDIQSNVMVINDEPHDLTELPYFDQSVKVFRTGSN